MAENKKSFVAYVEWNSIFEKLSDEEAGRLAKMIFGYVSDKNPECPDRLTELLFEPIKTRLKANLKAYEGKIEDNRQKGRLGNLKRWNNDLYEDVLGGKMTIEEAEEIAKHRRSYKIVATATKTSPIIADTDTDTDTEIYNSNNVLLKKEPKDIIDFAKLLNFINGKTGRDFKIINSTVKQKFKARIKDGYTKEDIQNAITNASKDEYHKENGCKYLTPEFFSRATTIDKYAAKTSVNTTVTTEPKRKKL